MHKSRNVTVQLHLFCCCGVEFTTTDQRSSPMCATTLCHCWFLDTQREFKTSILQYWWAAATASKEIRHVWQGRTSPPREQNWQSTKQNIFNVKAESEGTFIKHSPCFLSVLLSRCQAVQSSQNSPTLPQVLHVASLFDDLARPGTDGTDVAARLPMLDAK